MPDVLIIVESADPEATTLAASALKHAILTERKAAAKATNVEIVSASDLTDDTVADRLLCPLTLHLPPTLSFPGKAIYSACHNVDALRQKLTSWQYATGVGGFWLPIVLTEKGPLYAEVIGVEPGITSTAPLPQSQYKQPIHLLDHQRQPLYALGQRLLQSLDAPPAVYLMQYGWQGEALCFDRLLPFPTALAIASLKVQAPDLFTCHWYCLIGVPIVDLAIV